MQASYGQHITTADVSFEGWLPSLLFRPQVATLHVLVENLIYVVGKLS